MKKMGGKRNINIRMAEMLLVRVAVSWQSHTLCYCTAAMQASRPRTRATAQSMPYREGWSLGAQLDHGEAFIFRKKYSIVVLWHCFIH